MDNCGYFIPVLSSGTTLNDYLYNVVVTGETNSDNLISVTTGLFLPDGSPQYTPFINTNVNNPNEVFDGVVYDDSEKVTYVLGGNPNDIMNTGVHFTTFKNVIINGSNGLGQPITYFKTTFTTNQGGRTVQNTSLSPIVKREEYLGVVFKPEVNSDIFINRGIVDIFERHALLSEIKTTNDIDTNRGGFISS
tara:strand:- start:10 stop:585 length:576 start_codon:yes stop_codon:yes gene_type:complete